MFAIRVLVVGLVAPVAVSSSIAIAETSRDAAASPIFGDGNTRIGIGYDSRAKLRGELLQRLGGDEQTLWLGQAWIGDQAGGVELDRHWYREEAETVWKLLGAWDRNKSNDQKVTLGIGAESEGWFWGAYGSKGITGDRDLGITTSTTLTTVTRTDPALGDYTQDATTMTSVRTIERGYDYGIGTRIGKTFADVLVRVVGGLDYEWHQRSTSLTTVSLGVEKFFQSSPHSFLVNLAASERRGDHEDARSEHRAGIYWRYQFDGVPRSAISRQPATPTVIAETAADSRAPEAPNAVEPKVVRTTEEVTVETFFDLDRVTLKPEAFAILDRLAGRLRTSQIEGSLRVVGHTCELGPAAYNLRLSARRAAVVRDYLVTTGAIPADRVVALGAGEDQPRYANTRGERHKNRRCDIEFVVVDERIEAVEPVSPPMPTPAPILEPATDTPEDASYPWWKRALRNPITHKREVDAFTRRETRTTVVEGDRHYLNQAPVAIADQLSWFGSRMPAILDVLANDSDPDHDAIRIVSVTHGNNGDVTILPDNTLRYMWRRPLEGVDTFTYTIVDSKGATATAQVTLTVIDP